MRPPVRSGGRTVGVNLTWLVPGVVGGSEEYTVRLLEAAEAQLPADLRLRLYARADLVRTHPGLQVHEVVEVPVWPGGRLARVVQENTWLASRSRNDALVHHAGGTVPFRRPGSTVVTVHDLQPLEHPENFGLVKRQWLGRSLPYAVGAAQLVLCPSPHTASRLDIVLGVPPERIRVVPHGHRPPPDRDDAATTADQADDGPERRFGRYLLYPAVAYAHKRHIDLVQLLPRLGPGRDDVSLVLTGRAGPETGTVLAEAARLGLADRVHHLGRLPWDEVVALYRSATALVFPSAYEGFGNPAVEAMGLGCPAVVSDAGALPDVVGDAGLIFPVGDLDAMADAVGRVLDDEGLVEDLRRRGRRRAADFDVEIAAGRLVDVYREAVDTPDH